MSKIMSIDSLYNFFVEQNKSVKFSSRNAGKPIVVSMPGSFEASNDDMPGMLKLKLKVCHIDTNRNGSHISKENMEKAMPSLKYRPILAYIHKTEDGLDDFYAHNMEIIEDNNGEEKINYLEKQVGCFTADDPYLEYDADKDKTYVMAYAVIPEEYTSAADIIRRKNGTKVSCELVINELSYNAKEKYLDLTDFYFGGTTLLGCDEEGNEIGEGMLGSRADITDFCHSEPVFKYQDKLIETLEKLNYTLSSFQNTNTNEKGGEIEMDNFENTTVEETELENFEGTTEEIIEEASETDEVNENEACGGKKKKKCEEDEVEDSDSEESDVEESEVKEDNACGGKKKKKCSIEENGDMTISFEISHEDIRGALYNLLVEYEENDNEWYFVTSVYDNYFLYENWEGSKCYKQCYACDGDNVSFDGDRQEMFKMILTESEKLAIDKLRGDYSELESKYNELKEFKDNYDANEIKAKKDEVFAREEYSVLADDEGFKALIADAEKYSVEECENKADVMFAKYCKSHGEFANKEENKAHKVIGVNFAQKADIKDPYGGLWADYKKNNK